MKINKNYSGVIIENQKGRLLFQLRDNNLNISHSNKWSLFGGGIEKEETPMDTIIREIKEELNFKVDKNKLKVLFRRESKNSKSIIFYYKLDKDEENFRLGEGQKYDFLSLREIIFKKNVVPSLRLFMLIYPFLRERLSEI